MIQHAGITQDQGRAFKDKIVIRTTHPDRREFEIPAHLLIVKPILAVPPRAVLGYVPSKLPAPRIRLVPGDEVGEGQKTTTASMTDGGTLTLLGGIRELAEAINEPYLRMIQ